jgi:hypothetical protein
LSGETAARDPREQLRRTASDARWERQLNTAPQIRVERCGVPACSVTWSKRFATRRRRAWVAQSYKGNPMYIGGGALVLILIILIVLLARR